MIHKIRFAPGNVFFWEGGDGEGLLVCLSTLKAILTCYKRNERMEPNFGAKEPFTSLPRARVISHHGPKARLTVGRRPFNVATKDIS